MIVASNSPWVTTRPTMAFVATRSEKWIVPLLRAWRLMVSDARTFTVPYTAETAVPRCAT